MQHDGAFLKDLKIIIFKLNKIQSTLNMNLWKYIKI